MVRRADGHRPVVISHAQKSRRHKFMARDAEHGIKHSRVAYAAATELLFHHLTPFGFKKRCLGHTPVTCFQPSVVSCQPRAYSPTTLTTFATLRIAPPSEF